MAPWASSHLLPHGGRVCIPTLIVGPYRNNCHSSHEPDAYPSYKSALHRHLCLNYLPIQSVEEHEILSPFGWLHEEVSLGPTLVLANLSHLWRHMMVLKFYGHPNKCENLFPFNYNFFWFQFTSLEDCDMVLWVDFYSRGYFFGHWTLDFWVSTITWLSSKDVH